MGFTFIALGATKSILTGVQGKLRILERELPEATRKTGGCDLLLRTLAENGKDQKAPKTSAETFSEIITRYLYSPGEATKWNHLINKNRTLKTVCLRNPTWTLATTAVSVSSTIRKSWVVKSDSLYQMALNPSSMVCDSIRLGESELTYRSTAYLVHHRAHAAKVLDAVCADRSTG